MKAMILAAGFGSRLMPYSHHTPKPLFTVNGRPILDILITNLIKSGFGTIIINTHHLSEKIENFILSKKYKAKLILIHEPEILGTGGAIKNAGKFLKNKPFLVVNGDIFTNLNFKKLADYHKNHSYPATLALYDDENFNTVSVSEDGFVTGFDKNKNQAMKTFTGIQILDPQVLNFIPENSFSSSISAFLAMINSGKKIKAFFADEYEWKDLGTPERYKNFVKKIMAKKAFEKAWPGFSPGKIVFTRLKGDGSDRKWHRVKAYNKSLIMVDHDIRKTDKTIEVDSVADIGRHLFKKGINIPQIINYDRFSGLVFMKDLGNTHLMDFVCREKDQLKILNIYKQAIDNIIYLNIKGREDFDLSWTWQSKKYDTNLVLEKECLYFTDAFCNNYLELDIDFNNLKNEFEIIAEHAVNFGIYGFMHRDMQSKNIMICDGRVWFIDFQGGRLGPIQYDLASLIIDPYVNLSENIQKKLLEYAMKKLGDFTEFDDYDFKTGYRSCALARNLQILGAFAYLTKQKGKSWFEPYIIPAIKSLGKNIKNFRHDLPKLKNTVFMAMDILT